MSTMEQTKPLTAKQVFTRIISVLVCGVGASACGYSLTLQVAETGNIISSVTWFSGLFAVVFAIAGYAVTCNPGQKSYVPVAATIILILAIAGSALSRIFLYVDAVIISALIAAAIQCVVLIVYHFILKREDPDAI